MYDQILRWDALATFLVELQGHPAVYEASLEYIRKRPGGESWAILKSYHRKLALHGTRASRSTPIVGGEAPGPKGQRRQNGATEPVALRGSVLESLLPFLFVKSLEPEVLRDKRRLLRHAAKYVIPSALVEMYRARQRAGPR